MKVEAIITNVNFSDDSIALELLDGRVVSAPLEWFPRLRNATDLQRNKWRLIGKGIGVHWEEIDEDISVKSFLAHN